MSKKNDLTGQKFGKLTVLREGTKKGTKARWECVCECGKIVFPTSSNLITGNSKTCGCMQGLAIKHGMRSTRPYTIWTGMISRCSNPNYHKYPIYGARGISVCERWLKFENFWEDMKDTYNEKLSIERMDNDQGYNIDNCKWADNFEQSRNKSNTDLIEYDGVIKPLKDWAKEYNIKHTTLWMRLHKYKWDLKKAFNLT